LRYNIIMKRRAVLFFILFTVLSATRLSAQSAAQAPVQEKNAIDYSLKNLQTYQYKTSPISIQKLALKNDIQTAYNVSFTSMNLTVSASLRIPAGKSEDIKGIIIMLRGHQRPGGYYTGKGTENPAKVYLENGWAVIAPDFFGYASSSATPSPSFMHQFYSTINAVELYNSLEKPNFQYNAAVPQADRITLPSSFKKRVIWGHSNGGQVALHFLTIVKKPVATVLWAPVCIAFPDSAGHYGRGSEWAAEFKETYTAADYSFFSYLDKIAPGTPILLEQGDKDTAVPKTWCDTFSKAIEEENTRREKNSIGKILLRYEVYKNADHNLNPYWKTVLPRDIKFWEAN